METATESRHLEDAIREVDLPSAATRAWAQLETSHAGHTALTLMKRPGLRVVLLALKKGSEIPERSAAGDITVQVLSGEIVFEVSGQRLELGRGRLITVAGGLPHALRGVDDSQVLLTVAG